MNINARILLAGCCLACAPAFAGLSFVGTPAGLGSNDSTNWAQLGGDTTVLTGPFSATSALAVGVTGNFSAADNTGLVADVCPAAPTCSWTTSGAGMNAGDSDIWAFDNNAAGGAGAGTGPIDLSFSKSLLGAGAWLEGDTSGTYTASIQAFDGAVSLAPASTVVSNATGDPVFLGLLDTTAEITKIEFSLTSCAGCTNLGDFAIDTLLMTDTTSAPTTPEPSTLLLLGSGLAGVVWTARRKSRKNGGRA